MYHESAKTELTRNSRPNPKFLDGQASNTHAKRLTCTVIRIITDNLQLTTPEVWQPRDDLSGLLSPLRMSFDTFKAIMWYK